MGGAARFLVLLTTPFPLLHRRSSSSLLRLSRHRKFLLSSFHHLNCSPSYAPLLLSPPLKASRQLHNQAASSVRNGYLEDSSLGPHHSHPWPEWSKFIDHISASGYFDNRPCEDEFVAAGELNPFFLREASACLAFARDRQNILRLLSRRDVEVVVEHGTPFLFQDAEDSVRKMRSFISNSTISVLDSDQAHMVDLMKFMLSYTSNPLVLSERDNLRNRDLVESSVRNLFAELFKLTCNASGSNSCGAMQNQMPVRSGQTMAPTKKIEMKRGDWICPRCNFMNFARNIKCLECEEARPKRQLTGAEWECPQCDFYNYGRNMTCMRCDCKRPGQIQLAVVNTPTGVGFGNESRTNTSDIDGRLAANEEKAQRWFSKVSQLDSTSDINSMTSDEDFPEIMPLRKGVNRFVVSTKKTPLERRLDNTQYNRNLGNDGTGEVDDFQASKATKSPHTSVSQRLDEILGRPAGHSQSDNMSFASGHNTNTDSPPSISSSPQYRNLRSSDSGHAPFVPLPADTFAQTSENLKTGESKKVVPVSDAGSGNLGDSSHLSSSSNQLDRENKEQEQAEKSERWFRKVSELHNVSDLTSAISDEDFPEIMPMRKGENRFVVSKKKDRSLTSPAYKRQLAMEQASNTSYVPFVPFPPGYFAKKDKQQSDGTNSTDKLIIESASEVAEKLPEMSDDTGHRIEGGDYVKGMTNDGGFPARPGLQRRDYAQDGGNQDLSMNNWGPQASVQGSSNNDKDPGDKYTRYENKDHMPNSNESSSPTPENQNVRAQWTGKSLEGSAVKEPDPLDMSEEAKAERWFRRVAQIKDISELSQIPDEDFPSIMPMRKGVNRFVVSKRKTPLERRLTSQQYRKNLPVVSSDPIKKENEGS
ncbi:zinc finger protein VAR3, chloroplastic-like [Prosopis cineraria]|uniref:zinc finger protein VAR3, chloroplastic-like n=1 Tax=Prosopis cineraria TaxID=364024 RepID=UPI00240F0900|nr:zinc finger protein VAR3, chloroplastic-like [Prosopis cineraria]